MLTLTTPASSGTDACTIELADVLEILHARTGVNFANYRRAMLERRAGEQRGALDQAHRMRSVVDEDNPIVVGVVETQVDERGDRAGRRQAWTALLERSRP